MFVVLFVHLSLFNNFILLSMHPSILYFFISYFYDSYALHFLNVSVLNISIIHMLVTYICK